MASADEKADRAGKHGQYSESVYRDAVTKLRILLEATEAASNAAAEAEAEVINPVLLPPRSRVNLVGSVDRNINRVREEKADLQTVDRRIPKFTKNQNSRIGGVRRALFIHEARDEVLERRYNSCHNLAYSNDVRGEEEFSERSYSGNSAPVGELRVLIEKQENYIEQLEKETKFCRDQLATVLSQVQGFLPENLSGAETAAQSLKSFQKLMTDYASLTNSEDTKRLKLENAMLRQKLDSFDPEKVTNTMIEKLKKDNAILLQTLNQAREESEEIARREGEAVEQVRCSVQVAEQARMEKQELDFEVDQLKLQIERLQNRVRSLIEEQDSKVEEERILIERRAQEQIRIAREETESQSGEVGRLMAELDRQSRLELELRRQLKDRDRIIDDLQAEAEKRNGQLQLEIVNLNSTRQQLESELASVKLELDGVRQEFRSERGRLETEMESHRGRLRRTEEQLSNAREEILRLSETKSSLERENNLTKLQVQNVQHQLNQAENKLLQASQAPSAVDETREKFVEAKLRDLVQRQSKLVAELKRQCLMVADKLESTSAESQKEITKLQIHVDRLSDEKRRASEELLSVQAQCKEFSRVYERSVRRLETLEIENQQLNDEIDRLRRDLHAISREKSSLEKEIGFAKKHFLKAKPVGEKNSALIDKIRSQAVVVERNGQLTSPFVSEIAQI